MNLILGTAFNYSKNDLGLKIFVKSWKKYCPEEKLMLVVSPNIDLETYMWFFENDIEVLFFTAGHYIPTSINDTRFYKYIDVLLEKNNIANVFLTDTRDVVFQGNLFKEINEKGLHVFLEDHRWTCGSQPFNECMISTVFGEEEVKKLYNSRIICSGTTLGDRNSILEYMMVLINQRSMNQIIDHHINGIKISILDQGIHNYILHNNIIKHTQHENGDGVGTIALTPKDDIKVLSDGRIETYGFIPSIIHQWDRHKFLIEHLSSTYCDK